MFEKRFAIEYNNCISIYIFFFPGGIFNRIVKNIIFHCSTNTYNGERHVRSVLLQRNTRN